VHKVVEAIDLSRRIMRVVRQNIVFAVAVVLILLAGVIGRKVFLASGMLVHEATILIVDRKRLRLPEHGGDNRRRTYRELVLTI